MRYTLYGFLGGLATAIVFPMWLVVIITGGAALAAVKIRDGS